VIFHQIKVEKYIQGPCCHLKAKTLLVLFIFFSFEHAKNLLIMGPNNTKNSSKSVIFSYLDNIVRILLLLEKQHQI